MGDAAHLVAPFGARGMNSAIHDVENLAWKLAWVLRGDAPETLLDTYERERHPALRRDQQITNATMRFMAPRTRLQRLRRTVILHLSTRCITARRWVNSGRMSEPFTYQSSPILVSDTEPHRAWSHAPHIGAKAPDAPCTILNGSTRCGTWLRHLLNTGFLALYFSQNESTSPLLTHELLSRRTLNLTFWPVIPEMPRTIPGFPAIWDHTGQLADAFAAQAGTLFLIRPDGHIAARRRHTDATELIQLVQLASGSAPDDVIPGLHSMRTAYPTDQADDSRRIAANPTRVSNASAMRSPFRPDRPLQRREIGLVVDQHVTARRPTLVSALPSISGVRCERSIC